MAAAIALSVQICPRYSILYIIFHPSSFIHGYHEVYHLHMFLLGPEGVKGPKVSGVLLHWPLISEKV